MGDKQVGEVEFLAQILQKVDDLGLNGDVERRDRLVADDELRLHGQGPRDAHPLALSAAHLVGIAVGEPGVEATEIEKFPHPFVPRLRIGLDLVDFHGLADDGPDLHPRIERTVWVLEYDLDLLAQGDQFALAQVGHVDPVEINLPRGGAFESKDAAAGRGFPAPRFAYQAKGFAFAYVEAHPIHGLYMGDCPLDQDPLGDGEMHLEVPDLDQGLSRGPVGDRFRGLAGDRFRGLGHRGLIAHEASFWGTRRRSFSQQAERCPSLTGSSRGFSSAHRSTA